MVKIQINLSEAEDKTVEAYKLVNDLKTKEEAIKKMIQFFKVKVVPINLNEREEYYKKAVKFTEDKK